MPFDPASGACAGAPRPFCIGSGRDGGGAGIQGNLGETGGRLQNNQGAPSPSPTKRVPSSGPRRYCFKRGARAAPVARAELAGASGGALVHPGPVAHRACVTRS
eukprot:1342663-Pyramimonas_sp.AAC.1